MIKWFVRIAILGACFVVILVFVIGLFAYINLKAAQPPSVEDAPFAVQGYYEVEGREFPTRYYYAEELELVGGKAVLTNYWEYDGAKYHKVRDKIEVEPPFDIIRRSK